MINWDLERKLFREQHPYSKSDPRNLVIGALSQYLANASLYANLVSTRWNHPRTSYHLFDKIDATMKFDIEFLVDGVYNKFDVKSSVDYPDSICINIDHVFFSNIGKNVCKFVTVFGENNQMVVIDCDQAFQKFCNQHIRSTKFGIRFYRISYQDLMADNTLAKVSFPLFNPKYQDSTTFKSVFDIACQKFESCDDVIKNHSSFLDEYAVH